MIRILRGTVCMAGTVLIAVACASDKAQSTSGRVPAPTTSASIGSDWDDVRLIPRSQLALRGEWLSREELDLTDAPVHDGDRTELTFERTSADHLDVSEEAVRAWMDIGEATDIEVPSDCRVALKWDSQTGHTWWAFDFVGHPNELSDDRGTCLYFTDTVEAEETTDANGVTTRRTKRALTQGGYKTPDDRVVAGGPGKARIGMDDGLIEFGCLDSLCRDWQILAATRRNGDIYFFSVEVAP